MTTRLELRTALRRRLEDTGVMPLWDDAALNDFLGEAIKEYGTRFPRELTATVAVPAGATSVAVASPVIEPERIARVRDAMGGVVPRQGEERSGLAGDTEQAWRWWSGTLLLQRGPTETGDWAIEYLGGRQSPGDDVTAVEVIAGDEEIVVLLAAAMALRRRAVEDVKRGSGGMALSLADAARAEAERRIGRRQRRLKGGWVRPS
jgi:hypothetical protein